MIISIIIFLISFFILSHYLSPPRVVDTDLIPEEADIIVIGGGASGCTIARRMADKYPDKSVLILERGRDRRHDRNVYRSENALNIAYVEPYSEVLPSDSPNVICSFGTMYGGSSSHNFGLAVQGTKELYYDKWIDKFKISREDLDNKISNVYDMMNIVPLNTEINVISRVFPLIKLFRTEGITPIKESFDVFVNLGPLRASSQLSCDMLNAMTSAEDHKYGDIKPVQNYNQHTNCISFSQQFFIDKITGVRASVNKEYLPDNYNPSNLTMVRNAKITSLDLEALRININRECSCDQNHVNGSIKANDKIILSAGAIHSPYILLKSGLHYRGIGDNLTNHYGTQMIIAVKGISDFSAGPIAFLPVDNKDQRGIQIITTGSTLTNFGFIKSIGVNSEELIKEGFVFISYILFLLNPKTRGKVSMGVDKPNIELNLFENSDDTKSIVEGLKWLGGNYKALSKIYDTKAIYPPADILENGSYNELLDAAKKGVVSSDHYSSTLSSILNDDFSLPNYPNIHVVDASAFPYIPDGNTEFSAILVGEIASGKINI